MSNSSISRQKLLERASDPARTPFDYLVVGSGAGGGPLAARLARAGKRVLLIEALQQSPQPGRKARLASLAAAARFDWAQLEFLRSAPLPKQPGDVELIVSVGRQLQAMLWKVKKDD